MTFICSLPAQPFSVRTVLCITPEDTPYERYAENWLSIRGQSRGPGCSEWAWQEKDEAVKLSAEHVAKLEQFLEKIKGETYPELPSVQHTEITAKMMEHVFGTCALPQEARVLDTGCGQGVALQHFVARGCDATGVTLNAVDVEV